ncbi:hypothetical protein CsSME_00035618 [Camellia sinensis var. sinensis]
MEEVGSSSPPQQPASAVATSSTNNRKEESVMSRMKKGCLSFGVSLQEGFGFFKASLFGLTKKMTARNDKEATEADLQTAKMQVEATDAAEDIKKRLHDKSN